MDEGHNSGVTGIIDIPDEDALFEIDARAHETNLTAAVLDAAGRGDGDWPELRPGSSGGFITVTGRVNIDGWPLPDKFRGSTGTVTLVQHTGVEVEYAVRVVKATLTGDSAALGVQKHIDLRTGLRTTTSR